jgi:hypothetical protein
MEKYIAFEELEAQSMGLLADRVEMRRRRRGRRNRRGRDVSSSAFAVSYNNNLLLNLNDVKFD